MFLACHAQGPAGNTDCSTGLQHMQGLERMRFQDFAESADDEAMMLQGDGIRARSWYGNAFQYNLDQRLLEPAYRVG
jgi:hypothetical protein